MLSKKMQDALNKQLNAEVYSAYLYLSMSAAFEAGNLKGMAGWMRVQAGEEIKHAMKFFEFITGRSGRVLLTDVKAPQVDWKSPLATFEEAYKHECLLSRLVNDLVDMAIAEKDHATKTFLHWFVSEQVEEEASALVVVEQLKMVGDSKGALLMIDRQLGKRED